MRLFLLYQVLKNSIITLNRNSIKGLKYMISFIMPPILLATSIAILYSILYTLIIVFSHKKLNTFSAKKDILRIKNDFKKILIFSSSFLIFANIILHLYLLDYF